MYRLNKINLSHVLRRYLAAVLFLLCPLVASSNQAIEVDNFENGDKSTGRLEIFNDIKDEYSLSEIIQLYEKGKFKPLPGAGSTGLQPGSVWSHFSIRNTTNEELTLHIEYIDHQLISLDVFENIPAQEQFGHIASMSLAKPFDYRPIPHNRFVFPLYLEPGQTKNYLVKFGSDEMGFVFPSMRIWEPNKLRRAQNIESGLITFLIGGFFLMSTFALVAGIVIREKMFFSYSLYCLSKIIVWSTILGFTHQYIVTDNFHWSFMSISGAITILCGLVFARIFLQTKIYTPKLDYLILFMMANAGFLLICAMFRFKAISVISITIALLLYPTMSVVSFIRWRQGSKEALIFCMAWSVLVLGLVVQALRDLGYVEHNFFNYYWAPVASFTEMLAIMGAMGIMVQQLKVQKDLAEQKYRVQLENSKVELEKQVLERTRELERAKLTAEKEARTDSLTGISNRRNFFVESDKKLKLACLKELPLSLLMFDIDHFKLINDTYGHALGDTALRAFCNCISQHVRDSDIFGRLGGEEFALLLNEERHGTLQIAHRLQSEISSVSLDTHMGHLQFTASVGIAYLQKGEKTSIEELLNNADNALYVAKEKGRNQIIEHACPVDSNGHLKSV